MVDIRPTFERESELLRPARKAPRISGGTELTPLDRHITAVVDRYMRRGLDLKRWWDGVHARRDLQDRFEVAFTFNRPDVAFGFFDVAEVDRKPMPVLGVYQTQFYDQPKTPVDDRSAAARFIDAQVRQFVLRYFMRVADFRDPQAYTEDLPEPPPMLRPFSWCQRHDVKLQGFGYSQLYYKKRKGGEIGKFPESERSAIVDLRRVGPEFEWIVLKVNIFDFSFVFAPFGSAAPFVTLPLAEDSLLIVSPQFIVDEESPRRGELGHYGFGYSFIKNPEPGLLGWGPGEFDAAFQTIDFRVLADGRVRVEMVFIANRPTEILRIPLNPLELASWTAEAMPGPLGALATKLSAPMRAASRMMPFPSPTVDPVLGSLALVNLMTGGFAGRELCISRRELERDLILKHFEQHYNTIVGSLQTWRQIRDWLDEASLPEWVKTGEST
jgi:hypothetical protein